jgi:recombination protein RecR
MQRLIGEFSRLPGIGTKTAERLAYHILRSPSAEAMSLAEAIRLVKQDNRPCSNCFAISESDPCEICADPARDASTICVVEEPKDLIALERSGGYTGVYHVLGGRIEPFEGRTRSDLTLEALVRRVQTHKVKEIILATNPIVEGDTTALVVKEALQDMSVRITRLARGLPAGSHLEFAGRAILQEAITGRQEW